MQQLPQIKVPIELRSDKPIDYSILYDTAAVKIDPKSLAGWGGENMGISGPPFTPIAKLFETRLMVCMLGYANKEGVLNPMIMSVGRSGEWRGYHSVFEKRSPPNSQILYNKGIAIISADRMLHFIDTTVSRQLDSELRPIEGTDSITTTETKYTVDEMGFIELKEGRWTPAKALN